MKLSGLMADYQVPDPVTIPQPENDHSICALKMDINCCKECPVKLERKLLKSKGVKLVTIDQDQGMVTISGDIDPVVLLETIRKMGKEVELWFFQKKPLQNKGIAFGKDTMCLMCASKLKHRGAESDSEIEDGKFNHKVVESKSDRHCDQHSQHKSIPETKAKKEAGWEFGSRPDLRKDAPNVLGNSSLLPALNSYERSLMLPQPRYRSPWMYHQSVNGNRLRPAHGLGYYMQLPPPPAYPYFRSRSPPQSNPMVHYNSYADNHSYL